MARGGPGEAGRQARGVSGSRVGDGRRGARSRNAGALPCPPAFCLSGRVRCVDCRPLPLSSRVPWLRRADSGRRAGPTAAEAWCGWRRLAPARGGAGGRGGAREGVEQRRENGRRRKPSKDAPLYPNPPWTTSTRRQRASHALEAGGSDAMRIARMLDQTETIICLRSVVVGVALAPQAAIRPTETVAGPEGPDPDDCKVLGGDGRRPCPARGVAGVRAAWRGTLAVAGLSGPRFGAWRAWRVSGTGDRRGDRPGSSAGGSDSRYRGATRGWSSCSERPKPLGVASTMGSRQAWGRTRSRMMRGAAFRPLLRMRPQIMWVGLPAWGPPVAAAGAGVSRDAPRRWNRRAAPGFGRVFSGRTFALSETMGQCPVPDHVLEMECQVEGTPELVHLGECQCIDALQTLTAASFVKPEDWIYGSNPGNWIAKYNTRKQGECNAVTARCRDQTAPTQSTGTVAASGPRFLLGACGRCVLLGSGSLWLGGWGPLSTGRLPARCVLSVPRMGRWAGSRWTRPTVERRLVETLLGGVVAFVVGHRHAADASWMRTNEAMQSVPVLPGKPAFSSGQSHFQAVSSLSMARRSHR